MEVLKLFIGKLIKNGNKSFVERVVRDCFRELEQKHGKEKSLEIVYKGLKAIAPLVEIKSKKVGGTIYKIPIDVSEKRGEALGIGWLLESVKLNKYGKLSSRLCRELELASKGEGKVIERGRELHEFARKNRGLVKFL